jgi:putative phosphonate metabolism protein
MDGGMKSFKRYAVYYAPGSGAFATAAACWLGWDPVAGAPVAQPQLGVDLAVLTAAPRKYGFHGTIKPPFRLAEGVGLADLQAQTRALAAGLQRVRMPGLNMISLEGFLALVPKGNTDGLGHLAAEVVARLDPLRAPLSEAEVARRRPERLTPRQRELLANFGYPYVMEEFRFHLTLSDNLTPDQTVALQPLARAHFAHCLPEPFDVGDLCLFGEAEDGQFHLLHRYPLA